ncbi:MAG: right-handed parallel beta-helix repeat-containing protein, partial [Anaerolineae bacterium]|nr:right-handed parallel beta-helix repeat-containing protein [Anaerolineae bacterium]
LVDYEIHLQGSLIIQGGASLNLPAGIELRFPASTELRVYDSGTLNAQGSASAPIIFTANDDSPAAGFWNGLYFDADSTAILDYVTVEYAGRYTSYRYTGIEIASDDVTIAHSTIHHNAGSGIYVINSSPIIRYNNIYDNGTYGLYNSNTNTIVNAKNNYWGDVSGPAPFGSGNGINYRECYDSDTGTYYICEYYVDVTPWTGKQAEESETVVEDVLPEEASRNTSAMELGIPYIKSVDSEHDFFIFGFNDLGFGFDTTGLTVQVDWNGSDTGNGTPGSVIFKVGDHEYRQSAATESVQYDLPLSSLRAGFNEVEIVAKVWNSSGAVESTPVTVRIIRFIAPKWMIELGFDGTGMKFTQKPEYTEVEMYVKFPAEPFEAKADIPSFIPLVGGETGIKKSQATLNVSVRSDFKGSVKLEGETGFEADEQEVGGTLWGEGQVGFTPNNTLALYKAKMGVELEGTIKAREPMLTVIPPLAPLLQTPIIGDILGVAYIEGKIEPSVNFEAGFESEDDGTNLHWGNYEGGGILKVTPSLGVEVCEDVEASVYGGGEAAIQLQVPPDPSYLKELSGGFFVGAEVKVWVFEASADKTWEWSYKPQATRMMMGTATLTAPLPEIVARPVLTGTTDWHVEQPEYGTAPYAQFAGNRPSLRAPQRVLAAVTTPLVTNLYAHANPALALHASDALLLWVHDDTTLPDSQSKEIYTTWWNGSSWATPVAVTDNTMSEFSPQVAFVDASQAIAVWERINDPALPLTATFDFTTTRKVELAYAVFDLNTHTWGAPVLLTNNATLDHGAQLASGQDNTAMTVWTNNVVGDLIGNADAPDTLRYALWNGTSWSISGTIATGITGTLGTSLAYRNASSATLVLSLDTDGVFSTTNDIELFYTTWNGTTWDALTQLTDNTLPNESPTMLYTSAGERRLVWLQNNQLVLLGDDWGVAPVSTSIVGESATLRDFKVSIDADDNLMLLWQGLSEEGTDLYYALYNAETATWSLESQLTHSNAMEKQISPAFDANGQLMVAYALDNLTETVKIISPTLTITGVTEYASTDLYVLHYTPDTDLTLTDLSLPAYFDNPWPGDSVDVNITVQNAGDWAVVSPTLALYDGDPAMGGTLIATQTVVAGPLAGGATEDVTIRWTVPVTLVQPHTLYAVIDPAGIITESVETNNTLTLTTVTPDVSVASVKTYYYDQHNVVPLAVIANNGPVTVTDILVEFRQETVTGTIQHTDTITELAPYTLKAITTTWNVAGWAAGDHTYYAVVDSANTIFEINEDDNAEVFPVKVWPDVVIYSGDVQASLTASGGPVTVTVRNWGTADAANVPVTLYEGPVIITTGATALYTWTVPSLPVDSDGDVRLTTTLDHRPNRLFAIADPQRAITEVAEHNNVALMIQPISVTFTYHDLESIVPTTATVTLHGDWSSAPVTLTGAAGVYSVTVSTRKTPLTYRYAAGGNLAWLNTVSRTVTPTLATTYNDYRNVTPDDALLVEPATLSTTVGTPTTLITGQVTLADVTNLTGTTFVAEIGYGTSITLTEWTWTPLTYLGDDAGADQFAGVITPTASGTYSYTLRINGNWAGGNSHNVWHYTDLDGMSNGFTWSQVGVLTVP